MNKPRPLWRIDGDSLNLDFHGDQSRTWRSQHRHIYMVAGKQGGKTTFGPWWLWREITHPQRGGAGDYLAVTANYDLFKLKMRPELRTVFEKILRIGRYWAGDRIIELRDPATGRFWANKSDDEMWGRIILRSAVAKGGLESATAKAAWLDEAGEDDFTVEAKDAVEARLALYEGRMLVTTSLSNLGWIKTEYDEWGNGNRPDTDFIRFSSAVNPSFSRDEFDRLRSVLPDWKFQLWYLAQFAKPPGLIYRAYNDQPGGHLCDPFLVPARWPRAVAIDFGGANVAILWLALEPETGIWYLYKEWLGGGETTEAYCKRAKEGVGRGSGGAFAVGGAPGESQERRDWKSWGVPVLQPPISSVDLGITRTIGILKTNRFKVFKTCTGTRDEFGSYRRKLDDQGDPTETIIDKRKFHRLDALRYFCSTIADPALVAQTLTEPEEAIRVSVGY